MFNRSSLKNSTVSAMGAALISAACIFGVAGPAKAANGAAEWQQTVEDRFDAQLVTAANRPVFGEHDARVLVKLDGNGQVADASIIRTSGNKQLDREALRAARAVRYPAMPGALAGKPMKVELQAYFGTDAAITGKRAEKGRQLAAGTNADFFRQAQGVRLAAK